MSFSLSQCTAVITGASSGLGAEFARQLAKQARCLVLVARRLEALETVKSELQQLNPTLEVRLIPADLGLADGRAKVIETIWESGLRPNLLINNAGLGDYGSLAGATPEKLTQQIEVNISAVVLLTHGLLPLLKEQSPAGIINISSLASTLPMPDLAVYAASKAFVTSFSEALTVELAADRIQVTCVCPGPTPTHFSQTARRADGTDTDRSGQGLLRIPPQQVVAEALQAWCAGRACVFPGLGVSIAGPLFRMMPRGLMRWMLRRRFAKSKVTHSAA